MKTAVLVAMAALHVFAQTSAQTAERRAVKARIVENAKHNEEYRRLALRLNTFLAMWEADCKSQGQALRQQAGGDLACVAVPAVAPPIPPVASK